MKFPFEFSEKTPEKIEFLGMDGSALSFMGVEEEEENWNGIPAE